MAKTKLILIPLVAAALVSCETSPATSFTWEKIPMDGHRTGVAPITTVDWQPFLGFVDTVYHAPSGNDFGPGATMEAAKLLMAAQDRMAHLKETIGFCPEGMERHRPESELSNWAVDEMLEASKDIFGKKADIGILNFGGIRVEMPKGNVTVDDIHSMFPFKNYFAFVSLSGEDVRYIFDFMARRKKPEIVGGARFKIKDGKATDITIGGEPLDDKRIYGVISIDFLLDGGDSLYVGRNAKELLINDQKLGDWYEAHLRELNARGESIVAQKDGRIEIL